MGKTAVALALILGFISYTALAAGATMNLISLPMIPSNASVVSVMGEKGNLNDVIYRYNTNTAAFEYVRKRADGNWTGTSGFTTLDPGVGYLLKPVSSAYNFTLVGEVPQGSLTYHINATTGGVAMNLVGWNSPVENCSLQALIPGGALNDVIYRYNTTTSSFEYVRKRADGNWTGTAGFTCLTPGTGYLFKPVASSYDWTYSRP